MLANLQDFYHFCKLFPHNIKIPHNFPGCKDDEFTCNDGNCIPIDWRCDGIKDCKPNFEDESDYECSKGRVGLGLFISL